MPVLSPDPQDEDAFVEFLARLAEELEGPIPVFPTHDEPLNAIARGAERLGERFRYPFPPWEVLQRIQSKRSQLEAAEAAGIPVPRWATTSAAADELGYPVLVKPSSTEGFKRRFGRQAFRCETRAEVEEAFAEAAEYEPLVQEWIPGGDEELYTLGSYLDRDGEPLGLFCGRKLRQTPPGVGTCRVGEAVWVDEVVDHGLAFLRALGHVGLSQVEFKRDPRDGSYRLMEVNPRLWQWHGLAAACGVDFPRIAYEDLIGEKPDPARMNGQRRRWAITLLAGESAGAAAPAVRGRGLRARRPQACARPGGAAAAVNAIAADLRLRLAPRALPSAGWRRPRCSESGGCCLPRASGSGCGWPARPRACSCPVR